MTPLPSANGLAVHFVHAYGPPVQGGVETRLAEMGTRVQRAGGRAFIHAMDRTPEGAKLPWIGAVGGPKEQVFIRRYEPWVHRGGYTSFFLPTRAAIPTGSVVDLNGFPFLAGDALARLAGRRGWRVVATPHGPVPPPSRAHAAALAAYRSVLGDPSIRRASQVVTMTHVEAEAWRLAGVSPTKLREVPSGVGPDAFLRDPAPEELLLPEPPYFLVLGRLHRDKRPQDALEAAAVAKASVVFAGPDQGMSRALEAQARALGVPFAWRGPVSEPHKRALLRGCAALVLPSAWEAQGVVLLEAWAQGRPVIATNVGGVPAVVAHGRDGILVPVGDVRALARAMLAVLGDPARATDMGRRGEEKVRASYTWDVLAERLIGVYEDAAAEGA